MSLIRNTLTAAIVGLLLAACSQGDVPPTASRPATSAPASSPAQPPIPAPDPVGALAEASTRPTELEKTYLGAAGGYLKTQNEQGTRVATAMAGLNSGETTLEQVRKAIKDARFVTNMGFQGDYLKSGKLSVPDIFSSIDKQIRSSNALRDAAFAEYLAYWKDSNVAHIESGTATFKRSEQLAQDATNELATKMKAWQK